MSYNKAWEVGYARDRAQGSRRYVPATDTRAKLQELLDAHVPVRAIARASALSDTALARIIDGRRERVQRQTATRIASLTLADVYARASGNVPSVGAVRRVQALMALGWRKADLEAQGVPSGQLVTRSRDLISLKDWRQVRDVYERLSMTPGPSRRARDRAAARGYSPPLAWDEGAIDDAHATPQQDKPVDDDTVDPVAVARAVAGSTAAGCCDTKLRPTRDERVAVVRALTARGCSDAEMADVLGVCARTVLRLRRSHDIPTGRPRSLPTPSASSFDHPSSDRLRESPRPNDPMGSDRLRRSTQLDSTALATDSRPLGAVRARGA